MTDMTDITLEQRARQVIADWHREKGCSQQVVEDCLSGNITIPEFYMELLEAALRLPAGANAVEQLDEPEKDVALGQAVEFASYVEGHAKGGMRDAAKKFLSLPYAQKIAARLARAPEED